MTTSLDLLAVGETLVDFISTNPADSLAGAAQFTRYLGGSPANIAVTMARLGGRAAVASRVGAGPFGRFIRAELERLNVVTDYLSHDAQHRTTVVFVTRTQATPDFEVFHGADSELRADDISDAAIARAQIVHSSTFALSREPCRSAVISALQRGAAAGKVVSLDPNYNPQLWPDLAEARRVLTDVYQHVTITKPSLDDATRVFGAGLTPEQYIAQFHALGPRTVVLTLGKQGTLLSHAGSITHIPALNINVVDATGAGDAFWGGFLVAWLDGLSPVRCVEFAREVVALKLQRVGHDDTPIDRRQLYQSLEAPRAKSHETV